MNKIILADSQAIFRAGTAKVLAMDEDLRIIAQCTDLDRMYHAITTFPGSIVLFAASLRPDLTRLRMLLDTMGSRGIVIAENNEPPALICSRVSAASSFATSPARHWSSACAASPPAIPGSAPAHACRFARRRYGRHPRPRPPHPQGNAHRRPHRSGLQKPRDRLRLKTTEQVIKNYLRSIYDKTGVSDRLELALFTIHHRVLAQAAAEVGSKIEAEEQAAPAPSPSILSALQARLQPVPPYSFSATLLACVNRYR